MKPKFYIKPTFSFIFLICLTAVAFCDIPYKYWEFSKPIKIMDTSRKVIAIPLDQEVYNFARPDLNDIRLLNNLNNEVPYTIFTQAEVKKEKKLQKKGILNQVTETETILAVELNEPLSSFNSIKIIPERKNFVRKINIEGSNDNSSWKIIRKGIIVYSIFLEAQQTYLERYTNEVYTGYGFERYSEENLSVQFPEVSYKFLRVRIPHDKDKEPVALNDVEIFRTIKIDAEENTFKGTIIKSEINPISKSVDTIVGFGFKNLPLSRIILASNQSNFFRNVEIEAGNDLEKLEKVGRGVIFSISVDEETKENTTLNFRETKSRYLKIKIFNGDNKPIKLTSVTGYGLKQFVVFIPEKETPYILIYGNNAAKSVNYDVGELLKEKVISNFGKALLGDAIHNDKFQVYKEPKPWTEDKPYFLWIAMGIVGFGLIFLAFQVMKKIGHN